MIKNSKSIFYSLLAVIILILFVMCLIMYMVDPLNYYRYNEANFLENQYAMAGTAKNYPHTTEFIGSSVFENFDMERYEAANPGKKGLKITIGSMNFNEKLIVLSAERAIEGDGIYYIDMHSYFDDDIDMDNLTSVKYPMHLYNKTRADDYKYLLGYESWLRAFPIRLGMSVFEKLGLADFTDRRDINKYNMWHYTAVYDAERTKSLYDSFKLNYDREALRKNAKKNIDAFVEGVLSSTSPDAKITFVYSPYSIIYWLKVNEYDTLESVFMSRKLFAQKCSEYENIRIVDFQTMEEICDLGRYKDPMHYDLDMQNKMLDNLDKDTYLMTKENVTEHNEAIAKLVDEFSKENSDWVKQ